LSPEKNSYLIFGALLRYTPCMAPTFACTPCRANCASAATCNNSSTISGNSSFRRWWTLFQLSLQANISGKCLSSPPNSFVSTKTM